MGMNNGKVYTFDEVCDNNTKSNCWLIIHGKVYDATKFLKDHPGGDEILLSCKGKDGSEDFEGVGHSSNAKAMMEQMFVGEIDSSTLPKKTTYKPPNQPYYNHDKTYAFIFNVFQLVIPISILFVALSIHFYTKFT